MADASSLMVSKYPARCSGSLLPLISFHFISFDFLPYSFIFIFALCRLDGSFLGNSIEFEPCGM